MGRSISVLVVLAGIFALAISGCSSDSAGPMVEEDSSSFLNHINRGCISHKDEPVYEAYLLGYTLEGDTLSLDVHFFDECLSEYIDDVVIDGDFISISVADTQTWGADCTCNYESTFRFLWDGPAEIDIHFACYGKYSEYPICEFDTLIVVSNNLDGD